MGTGTPCRKSSFRNPSERPSGVPAKIAKKCPHRISARSPARRLRTAVPRLPSENGYGRGNSAFNRFRPTLSGKRCASPLENPTGCLRGVVNRVARSGSESPAPRKPGAPISPFSGVSRRHLGAGKRLTLPRPCGEADENCPNRIRPPPQLRRQRRRNPRRSCKPWCARPLRPNSSGRKGSARYHGLAVIGGGWTFLHRRPRGGEAASRYRASPPGAALQSFAPPPRRLTTGMIDRVPLSGPAFAPPIPNSRPKRKADRRR